MDVTKKVVYLYGNAKITYGDISLKAARIEINWETNVMSAYPALDSTGKKTGTPVFQEGQDLYVVDTIRYNAKTRKALIKGVVTRQGEGYVHGEKIKKVEDNLYISSARYTTCDLAHPHFYIKARKLKVIPEDKIISGPFNLVIADVPTPAGFFLGFFPVPKRNKSGLIIPTFGSDSRRGFFLREGGYYWAVNDYLGLQMVGDLYANGSFRTNLTGSYRKRYAYQGNIAFSLSGVKNSFDESTSDPMRRDINFVWTHSTTSRRNSSLTANVNILSSGYYKQNSYNPRTFQQGTFSSTVMYTKTFANTPFNMNIALRQDQSITTRVMNFTLPEAAFNMNRVYPFKNLTRGTDIGSSILNNLYVQYSLNTKIFITNDSSRTGYDSTYSFNAQNLSLLLKKAEYGAKHTIPIGTTLKFKKTFLKYFNFSPNATLEQWFYPYDIEYVFDYHQKRPVPVRRSGFRAPFSYSGGVSMNTNIYGMYNFKSKKLLGIRHTINPIIGYTFRPDFTTGNFQNNIQIDTTAQRFETRSRYTGLTYGGPGGATSSLLTFNINNIIEAKTASKKDTITGTKKFKLIDQLNLSGSYNFADTSFYKLSTINVQGRSRLLNRFDIYTSATYDPYAYKYNPVTRRSERAGAYAISKGQGLATLVAYNLSIGANLNPPARKSQAKKKNVDPKDLADINAQPELYVDFDIPFTLNANYNIYSSKSFTTAPNSVTQTLSLNGDVKLSEKWKVAFNTAYDIKANAITNASSIQIHRDLHCWQMSLQINPVGPYKAFFFNINAKSSILRDLKLNKRSSSFYGSYLY